LRLTHIRNPNAAFGLSFGRGVPLLPFALLAICILLLAFYKTGSRGGVGLAGLSLVLGGALGNLIDRVRFREVVDFVDIGIGKFRWPVFNVADSCVTVGVILLILGSLLFSGKKGSVLEHEQSDLTAGS
jgi:signal peptidase II